VIDDPGEIIASTIEQGAGQWRCRCGKPGFRMAMRTTKFGYEWAVVEHRSHWLGDAVGRGERHWCFDSSWHWHWSPSRRWARRRYRRTVQSTIQSWARHKARQAAIEEASSD
jgi:hypothetical protein